MTETGVKTPTGWGDARSVFVYPFFFAVEDEELFKILERDVRRELIAPDVLMGRFLLLDEKSRQSPAYVDPRYAPFYYHLGKYVTPRTVIEIGFRLGLFSGCFVQSCKTVERLLAFQQRGDQPYSPRLGIKNVRRNYAGRLDVIVGTTADPEFTDAVGSAEWDLVIVNEEVGYDLHRTYLDTVWPRMRLGGLVVMDYVKTHEFAGKAYHDFCKVKNRPPFVFGTRYGTGIIRK